METEQKKTAETFNAYQSHYSDTVNDAVSFTGLDVDFFTRVKADYLLDIAKQNFGDASALDVLDVGCGVGNFHKILAPKFKSLSGVDVSEDSIEKAKALHKDVAYQSYPGDTLPYADGQFDLVFTVCVIHHVPTEHWDGFVREMRRVLKSGGVAVIFEHNPLNPLTMRTVNNCPFDEDAVLLKSSKAISLMENAGLEDIKPRFIISVPPANKFLRWVDQLFSRIPLGAQYFVSAKQP